jgi:transcriptional regulator GlxA family with amidase domain
MLREIDLSLDVVAARTGLRDASHLVRRFRDRASPRRDGAAPSEHGHDNGRRNRIRFILNRCPF